MKKKLNITVLVDQGEIPPGDPEFKNPPEEPITEYHVIEELRLLGHNISVLGADRDVEVMSRALKEYEPDLVFNLTEHLEGDRRFDKHIASFLDMIDIPFTGAGLTGLLLTRDKRLCKQLLSLHRIRVPKYVFFPFKKQVKIPKTLNFPLVVKPVLEDSSEGIANASIVENVEALKDRVQFVHERWEQGVIAEEYIEGRECYVGVLGNKQLRVLPIRECHFNFEGSDGPRLATYRVKWNAEYRKKWNITFGFADLEAPMVKKIERVCKKIFRILELRDYGRIDLRLTWDNKIYILEANANPDLAYGEEVAEAAEKAGITYQNLIKLIISYALRRYA